jgi:hypothetical protein
MIVTAFHACLFTIMWFVISGPVLNIVSGPVNRAFKLDSNKARKSAPSKKVVVVKKAAPSRKKVEGMVV